MSSYVAVREGGKQDGTNGHVVLIQPESLYPSSRLSTPNPSSPQCFP